MHENQKSRTGVGKMHSSTLAVGVACLAACVARTEHWDAHGVAQGDLQIPMHADGHPALGDAAGGAPSGDAGGALAGDRQSGDTACTDLDMDGHCAVDDCDDSVATGPSCWQTCATFHEDADSNGVGDPTSSVQACVAPPGFTDFLEIPWGTFAAALPIADCTAGEVLTVDTIDGNLDGSTAITDAAQALPGLSLPEAIVIAANREGGQLIQFDADVFPVESPAVITFDATIGTQLLVADCLDARGRGVVVRWPVGAEACGLSCTWQMGQGASMLGLTLLRLPANLLLRGGRLAGNRIETDGYSIFHDVNSPARSVNVSSPSEIGPGNVMMGRRDALRVRHSASPGDTIVHGNYFGYDPATRQHLAGPRVVYVDGGGDPAANRLIIRDNEIHGASALITTNSQSATYTIEIRDNIFGGQAAMPSDAEARDYGTILTFQAHRYIFGPRNRLWGGFIFLGNASFPPESFVITQNNTAGFMLSLTPGIGDTPVPILAGATAAEITGTCATPGDVEVFVDTAFTGLRYLGTAACDAAVPWVLAGVDMVVSGQNVFASLTTPPPAMSSVLSAVFVVP